MALALLLLAALGVRLLYFTGLQAGDDLEYSLIAFQRLGGEFHISNVHEARSGFLLPITLSYALFGVGEVPLLLYNLLCSLGLVATVFFMARRFWGDAAGAIAAGFAALHPNLVFFATECHTDTAVGLWQALSVFALISATEAERPSRKLILSGLLLGWAYLHKEHAVFLAPFYAGHWIATRRRWTWYLPLALAALGVFVAESLVSAIVTGNPLKRFEMISSMHVGRYMVERYTTASEISYRLFLELPRQLFRSRYYYDFQGLINLVGLGLGIAGVVRKTPGARLLTGWWATLYLAYCFWPSSIVPLLPAFFLFDWTLPPLVGPLACFAGGGIARWRRPVVAAVAAALAAASLLSIHTLWGPGQRFTVGPKEAQAWISREGPTHVITDDKTIELLDFLDGHRPARRYTSFKAVNDYRGAVVVVDKFWSQPGHWWSQPVPGEVNRPPPTWKKVYESDRVALYRPE